MSAFTASTDSLSGLPSVADIQVMTCKKAEQKTFFSRNGISNQNRNMIFAYLLRAF